MPDFGVWLQNELSKNDMNQVELSRRSGIAQSHISRILKGKRVAGRKIVLGIAKALNLPSKEVLSAAGFFLDDPDWTPTLEEMNVKFSVLPPHKQEMILGLLDSMIEQEKRKAQ